MIDVRGGMCTSHKYSFIYTFTYSLFSVHHVLLFVYAASRGHAERRAVGGFTGGGDTVRDLDRGSWIVDRGGYVQFRADVSCARCKRAFTTDLYGFYMRSPLP